MKHNQRYKSTLGYPGKVTKIYGSQRVDHADDFKFSSIHVVDPPATILQNSFVQQQNDAYRFEILVI